MDKLDRDMRLLARLAERISKKYGDIHVSTFCCGGLSRTAYQIDDGEVKTVWLHDKEAV